MNPYRLLLLAFPRHVRDEFGHEMELLFEQQLRAVRESGGSPTRVWCSAIGDAVVHGFGERLERARRAARIVSGMRRWRWWMNALMQDLRYAGRLLRADRGTSFIAILTLALGIGANTATFSAVDAVLLRPLPYPDPDKLVMVWEKRPAEGVFDNVAAAADFVDWEKMNTVFSSMAAVSGLTVDLTEGGEPIRISAAAVTPAFFDVLRVQPALGRSFVPEEGVVGRHRVMVIGHELWRDRFGSDGAIVGRKILLSGIPHEVIGVLPPTFRFPDASVQIWAPPDAAIQVWVPEPFQGLPQPLSRASHEYWVYARLKPGIDLSTARADMDRVGALLAEQHPDTNRSHSAWVSLLADEVREPIRAGLWLLLGAVAFVLLIACVNVSNLLLARAVSRRRELAVRAAVGASQARLAGQMITESLLLGILGGTGGLLVAYWGIRREWRMPGANLAILGMDAIAIDLRVLAFTGAISLLTAVLFGTLPAWSAAGQDVNEVLTSSSRTAVGVKRRLRSALVVSEIALASLLLVGTGLTWRSLHALLNAEPGVKLDSVLTAFIRLPNSRYKGADKLLTTFDQIEERFAAIAGVRAVGATNILPIGGGDSRRGIGIEGREPDPDTPTRAHPRSVTPGYFNAMGVQLKAGRAFTPADTADAPLVVIVNETMARRYWPNESPIRRRITLAGTQVWREVVGVVGDVRHWGLDQPVNPEMYFPLPQMPSSALTFVLSTDRTPSALVPEVREQLRVIDPELPLSNVLTMGQVAAQSVNDRAAAVRMLAIFGIMALALAAAGIYGVMAQIVTMRRGEIGVRLTLGAQPADVMRLILREGVGQAVFGLVLGLGAAALLMRGFRSMLYEVSPTDPLTLAAVAAILLAAALLACLVPARRAMRVDPVATLRQ
jgi:putative ABC transport system permease protein